MVREGEKRGEKSGKNPAAMRYRGEIADLYYQSTASRPLPNSSLSHLRLTVPPYILSYIRLRVTYSGSINFLARYRID